MEEQKQSYEKELDGVRAKIRKQRTAESATNNQEVRFFLLFKFILEKN